MNEYAHETRIVARLAMAKKKIELFEKIRARAEEGKMDIDIESLEPDEKLLLESLGYKVTLKTIFDEDEKSAVQFHKVHWGFGQ